MKDLFWVIPCENDHKEWYKIMTTDTFICLSGVESWEEVERCLTNFCKKYRSGVKIRDRIDQMDYSSHPNDLEVERLNDLYDLYGGYRQKDIKEVISHAMSEVAEENRKNKPLNKVIGRIQKRPKVISENTQGEKTLTTLKAIPVKTPKVIFPRKRLRTV